MHTDATKSITNVDIIILTISISIFFVELFNFMHSFKVFIYYII